MVALKILALSDTQLGSGRHLAVDRLADQEAVLDQVALLAEREDVDLVVHCGDVFDSRTPSDAARLVFKRFAANLVFARPRDFVVVAGNHDLRNVALPSAVDVTDEHYDFVREPRVIQTRAGALACLPWAPPGHYIASRNGSSREQLNAEIAELVVAVASDLREKCGDGPCFLAGHWMVSGGSLPNGLPVDLLGGPVLPLSDLEDLGFDLCLFGDVHVPERLGDGSVISVGSPALNDWGEENVAHGCWLIDTDDVLNPKMVGLLDRRFQTVDVDLREAPASQNGIPLDETDLIASEIASHFPLVDATVRVRVRCSAEQARRIDWAPLRESLTEPVATGGAGVHRLIVAPPDIERVERARVAGVDETLSPLEAVDLYVEAQHMESTPALALRDLTVELLEEVRA